MSGPDHSTVPLLAGVLSDFGLADALQLLELGSRSGTLVVDGGPLGCGTLELAAGRIVGAASPGHARFAGADVVAVVAALLDLNAGRWTFLGRGGDVGVRPREGDVCLSVSAVLLDAARRRDETASGAMPGAGGGQDVPTPAALDADVAPEDAAVGSLTAAHLRVLAAVDGVRDLAAIAAATRADLARVRASVTLLRALGLVSPRAEATVGADVA